MKPNLLQDWPLVRIWLTFVRHLAIRILLSIPYDSSGAFRCINCKKVSLSDLILAKDNGYSYFWESIFPQIDGAFFCGDNGIFSVWLAVCHIFGVLFLFFK